MNIALRYIRIYLLVIIAMLALLLLGGILPPPGASIIAAMVSLIWLINKLAKAEKPKLLSSLEKKVLFSTVMAIEVVMTSIYAFLIFKSALVTLVGGVTVGLMFLPLAWYMVFRFADNAVIEHKI